MNRRTGDAQCWTRRRWLQGAAAAALTGSVGAEPGASSVGQWWTARGDSRLTGVQPLPGRMRRSPAVVARHSVPGYPPALQPFSSRPGGSVDRVLHVRGGRARCYALDGALLWHSHPRGLNFERAVAVEDMDGDGRVEIVLAAGRPKDPLGAVAVLDAESGRLVFRYDLDAISYWWTLETGSYLAGVSGKQILVCEHGYPPDEKNGFVALLDWERPGAAPRLRWRYDFSEYTSLPTLITGDLDGDGAREICVQSHSRMWILDAPTGRLRQFARWDVAPANVRSYGLIRFQDLNGDGREDFFCIANFAQHHEVLLNEGGQLKRAWAHGWSDNVTTRKIATVWPEPPIADVDGDGKLEMVVSMFNAETEPRWMVRVYDAVTGRLKARLLDRIAVQTGDLDGDGAAELLVEHSTDANRARSEGMALGKVQPGAPEPWRELWRDARALPVEPPTARQESTHTREGRRLTRVEPAVPMLVRQGDRRNELVWSQDRVELRPWAAAATPRGPDLSRIPARGAPVVEPPVIADVDGDGVNEILLWVRGRVSLQRYRKGSGLTTLQEWDSDGAPIAADLDGDGRLEIVLGRAGVDRDPTVRAVRYPENRTLWETTLPKPTAVGVPFGRALYFVAGRFLGRSGADVYVYVGTPLVRSLMLHGGTGARVWERGEVTEIGRHFAPTKNLAAVYDVDGDGRDDLVFTVPDYYCVAEGATGKSLVGPLFPPKIFRQPSQGLYTLPAILETPGREPFVCLVDGHYFQGVMTPRARPAWHRLPVVGEARAGAEGFLRREDGEWRMGFGRENGRFACIEVASGRQLWELDLGASASPTVSCDIDGDGRPEFLFGTSHGEIYAVRDQGARGEVLWKQQVDAGVSWVVPADVDGDRRTELVVGTNAGEILILDR